MSGQACDVVIVGAGCAGASLAALLARRGASVVVLDRERMPRFYFARDEGRPRSAGSAAMRGVRTGGGRSR